MFRAYFGATMAEVPSNRDLLDWFSEGRARCLQFLR